MSKSILFTLALLSITQVYADNFGTVSEDVKLQEQEERIQQLVADSAQTRKWLNGRSVAGMTAEDKYWADEFDKLMDDESDRDYLEESLKL